MKIKITKRMYNIFLFIVSQCLALYGAYCLYMNEPLKGYLKGLSALMLIFDLTFIMFYILFLILFGIPALLEDK